MTPRQVGLSFVLAAILAVILSSLQGSGSGRDEGALRAEVGRLALESARLSRELEECRREKDGEGPGQRPELVPVPSPTP